MADKTIVIRIAVKAGQAVQGLNQVGGAVSVMAGEVEQGTKRVNSSVRALGAASAFAGKAMLVGIGGAMAVSAQAAIEFESSLAGVAKTVDFAGTRFGEATNPTEAFGEALRSLALRTPIGVNDLARIAEVGGQLGVEADNLIEFTEVMAALGVSTTLSAEEAATGLARFANIMGTPQDEFDILGSILVELGNNLATTEGEILTFGTRIAAVGQTVGASEADVLALAGALSSLGIPAERGGTAVQRVMIAMQEAIINASGKMEAFAEVAGVSGEEFAALFAESPARAFEQFVRGLDRITQSGGNVFRTLDQLELDSVRTTQVLLAAAGGADVLAESINRASTEAVENNALFEEAARRYGTTESQIKLVANAFTDLRLEIGNALLGTGGLAATLDIFREFFGILKNNLDVLGAIALAFAALTTIKLALWAANAWSETIKLAQGLRAAHQSATALQVATSAVNAITLTAAIGVGLLAAAWANAAREAAEMDALARNITDSIEEGEDFASALTRELANAQRGGLFGFGESMVFSGEALDAMRNLTGYTKDEFIAAVIAGEDVLNNLFENAGIGADATGDRLVLLARHFQDMGRNVSTGEVTKEFELLNRMVKEIEESTVGFASRRAGEFADAWREVGATLPFHELHTLGLEFLKLTGYAATTEEAVEWFLYGRTPQGETDYIRSVVKAGEATQDFEQTWLQFVGSLEGGDDLIEDFFDSTASAAETFAESIGDAFEAVDEEVRNGMPAWDEYEKMVSVNLQGVIDSFDAFIEDMTKWGEVQAEIIDEVSPEIFAFLSGQDAPTKGALARLFESDRAEFDRFVREMTANFAEVNQLILDRWLLEMPTATRQAYDLALGEIRRSHDAMNLEGGKAAAALVDGLNAFLAANGIDAALETLLFADAAFRRSLFETFGFELGAAILQGIVAGLATGPGDAFGEAVESVNDRIKTQLNKDWEVSSPSRVTMRLGEDIAEGLRIGIDSNMPAAFHSLTPQSIPMPPTPIVNVAPSEASRSATIHINNPTTHDLDRDLSYAATVAGLMTEVGG